jgi:hypothetical protein
VATGKEILPPLGGHDKGVQWVRFRGDGKFLVVGENYKVTRYDMGDLPK